MKTKAIIIGFLAITTLLSCSKNTTEQDDQTAKIPVSFNAGVGKQSKAIDATLATLKAPDNSIGLFVYSGKDGYPGGANLDNAIAANYKMYWDNTLSKWLVVDYADAPVTFYWPGEGSNFRLSFYAYYPNGSDNITAITPNNVGVGVNSVPSFEFTAAADVANQIDLLTARNEPSSPTVTVALPFNHATTKFSFRAQTNVKEWRVTIHSVTLKGLNNTGKYTFATKTPPATVNSNWSQQSGNQTYQVPLADAAGVSFDVYAGYTQISSTAAGQSMFLLPQDLSKNGNTPTLEIEYSIVNHITGTVLADHQTKILYIGNQSSIADGELNTIWSKGHVMNYQLTFSASEPGEPGSIINFDVTVNEWSLDNNPFN